MGRSCNLRFAFLAAYPLLVTQVGCRRCGTPIKQPDHLFEWSGGSVPQLSVFLPIEASVLGSGVRRVFPALMPSCWGVAPPPLHSQRDRGWHCVIFVARIRRRMWYTNIFESWDVQFTAVQAPSTRPSFYLMYWGRGSGHALYHGRRSSGSPAPYIGIPTNLNLGYSNQRRCVGPRPLIGIISIKSKCYQHFAMAYHGGLVGITPPINPVAARIWGSTRVFRCPSWSK